VSWWALIRPPFARTADSLCSRKELRLEGAEERREGWKWGRSIPTIVAMYYEVFLWSSFVLSLLGLNFATEDARRMNWVYWY
jgi:hypothetical protein